MLWSTDDIHRLFNWYMNDIPKDIIAESLGRSPEAIRKALSNIKRQQCVHHSINDVAQLHACDADELMKTVASNKYYVSIYEPVRRKKIRMKYGECDFDISDEVSNSNESDTTIDEIQTENKTVPIFGISLILYCIMLSFLFRAFTIYVVAPSWIDQPLVNTK